MKLVDYISSCIFVLPLVNWGQINMGAWVLVAIDQLV
jgi:hypothetical protein